MTLTIRPATEADLPLYVRLLPELHVDDPVPSVERWRTEMQPAMLIAERNGVGLGFCWFQRLEGSGYVRQVVSAPEARRLGVGRALLLEVARQLQAANCTSWRLNVKPENTAAIGLYASLGFRREYASTSLGIPWGVLTQLPPSPGRVRTLEPADDAKVEEEFELPSGQLANAREARRVMLLAVDASDTPRGLALFNPSYPGAFPFRVKDLAYTRALLEAMQRHTPASAPQVGVVSEKDEALVTQLRSAGAVLRMVFDHYVSHSFPRP